MLKSERSGTVRSRNGHGTVTVTGENQKIYCIIGILFQTEFRDSIVIYDKESGYAVKILKKMFFRANIGLFWD